MLENDAPQKRQHDELLLIRQSKNALQKRLVERKKHALPRRDTGLMKLVKLKRLAKLKKPASSKRDN